MAKDNKVTDELVNYMNKLKELELKAKNDGVYKQGSISELFTLAYREIRYCNIENIVSSNIQNYIERIQKKMKFYQNSINSPLLDVPNREQTNFDKYVRWTEQEVPKMTSADIIEYIKGKKPEEIVFTYLLGRMTPEQLDNETLIKIMALSSGFGDYIVDDNDYYSLFAAQRLRYSSNNIEDSLKYFYLLDGKLCVKVGKVYIAVNCIIDRMDFSAIIKNNAGASKATKNANAKSFIDSLEIKESSSVAEVINYSALEKHLAIIRNTVNDDSSDENIANVLKEYKVVHEAKIDEQSLSLVVDWVRENIDDMEKLIAERKQLSSKKTGNPVKEEGRRLRVKYIKDHYGDKIKTVDKSSNAQMISTVPRFW